MLVLKNRFLNILIFSLIALEFSLPKIGALKSQYLFLAICFVFLLPQAIKLSKLVRFKNQARTLQRLFLFYLCFLLMSVLWSVTPFVSCVHAVLLLVTFFYIRAAAYYSPDETIKVLLRASLALMALSWVALLVSPSFALQEKGIWRLRGIFYHEFELGFLSCIVIITLCAFWISENKFFKSRTIYWLVLNFAILTLLATQTRTLIVYTTIVCSIMLVRHVRGKKRVFLFFSSLMVAALLVASSDLILKKFDRGESDATLSGRTIIWERSLRTVQGNSILGFGFASFDSSKFNKPLLGRHGQYRAPHAHNTWVMAYFESGLLGMVLLTIFLVYKLFLGFKLRNQRMITPFLGFYFALFCTLVGATSLIYAGKVSALLFVPYLLYLQSLKVLKRSFKPK